MTPPEGELRAAIVQDAETGRVLMLAWMDDEAERRTRESGEAWFWSRSRAGVLAQGRDLREHDGGRGAARRLRRRRAARCACARTGPPATPARSRASRPALWRTISERARSGPRARTRRSCSTRASPPCARKVGEEAVEVVTAALVGERRARRLGGRRPRSTTCTCCSPRAASTSPRSRTSSPAARARKRAS